MLLIDKYAYINKLASVHPLEKMVLSLGLLLFSLIVRDELISLITFVVMSAFIIIGAKIPIKYYCKLLLLPGFFLISSLVTILISIAPSSIMLPTHYWDMTIGNFSLFIGHQSVDTARQLFFIVLGSISCLYFLILTTSVQAICQVLRKCHMPLLLIELIELTYRFIFVFLESAQKIYIAQHSRLGYHSPAQWLRSISMLISALFAEVITRSHELTNAMLSRGGSESSIYWEEIKPYCLKNWLMIIIIFLLFGCMYGIYGGHF